MIGARASGLTSVNPAFAPLAAVSWDVWTAVALAAVAAALIAAAVSRRRAALAWPAIWLLAGALFAVVFGAVYGLAAGLLALAPRPGGTWGSR
jgi:hypothetical protein